MAIDTQLLRSAALRNSGRGLPFPDGSISSGDRVILLGMYPLTDSNYQVRSASSLNLPNYARTLDMPVYTKSTNAT